MASIIPTVHCPSCGGRDARRSRRGWFDRIAGMLFLRPFRCHSCYARFWRFSLKST